MTHEPTGTTYGGRRGRRGTSFSIPAAGGPTIPNPYCGTYSKHNRVFVTGTNTSGILYNRETGYLWVELTSLADASFGNDQEIIEYDNELNEQNRINIGQTTLNLLGYDNQNAIVSSGYLKANSSSNTKIYRVTPSGTFTEVFNTANVHETPRGIMYDSDKSRIYAMFQNGDGNGNEVLAFDTSWNRVADDHNISQYYSSAKPQNGYYDGSYYNILLSNDKVMYLDTTWTYVATCSISLTGTSNAGGFCLNRDEPEVFATDSDNGLSVTDYETS
jgi:hypothetical protein